MIDKAKGQHCVTGERALDWNERGRRGRRGARGPQGIQGEPGDSILGLDFLAASSVLNDDPASHAISFTIPEGTIVRTLWYRETVTTPTGPCDALAETGSIIGNHEVNGGFAGQLEAFNFTVKPGTTYLPGLGSHVFTNGVLFPGDYEFATLVTDNNLVPDCWGTVIETRIILETQAS